jgi:hypothetical protein
MATIELGRVSLGRHESVLDIAVPALMNVEHRHPPGKPFGECCNLRAPCRWTMVHGWSRPDDSAGLFSIAQVSHSGALDESWI